MRSLVEGACSVEVTVTANAPSTALRAVPLPRFAGQDAFHSGSFGSSPRTRRVVAAATAAGLVWRKVQTTRGARRAWP